MDTFLPFVFWNVSGIQANEIYSGDLPSGVALPFLSLT